MARNLAGMTNGEEAFCVEFAKTGNASASYRVAYPNSKAKPPTINVLASRLLAKDKIQLRIAELRQKAEQFTDMTIERWAKEVTRLATSDIRQIMHPNGKMKLPHELDEDTAAAVASFKIDIDGTIEYKFWPKAQPLDMMAKHKGAYERDNKQKADPLAELFKSLSGNVMRPVKDSNQEREDE